MNTPKKVLLINTHLKYPGWSEGKLNEAFHLKAKAFFEAHNFEVLETYVEQGYDAENEVEKHLEADIIILQTPVNWFGAPWIYKQYVDKVFNIGLHTQKFLTGDGRTREDPARQYGTGGQLQGRKFMVCATWNAPAEAFGNPDQKLFEGISTKDFFQHITANYKFCGVEVVQGYNCYDIFKKGDIIADLENYPKHLSNVFGL